MKLSPTEYAFVAVSPTGIPIMITIASSPEAAWHYLRETIEDPQSILQHGWRIARLRCEIDEVFQDTEMRALDARVLR